MRTLWVTHRRQKQSGWWVYQMANCGRHWRRSYVFRMFDCATVLVSHGRDGRQRPTAIRTFGRKAPLLHFLPPLGIPGCSYLQGLRVRLGQHRAHHEDALLTCVVGLCISIGL